jgi:hypothetical protein
MTLADFHTNISSIINQGTRLDAFIPMVVRQAARTIEQDYSYLYMDRFVEIVLDVSLSNPRFLTWPVQDGANNMKRIQFIRYLGSGGSDDEYTYLTKIDPEQVTEVTSDEPLGYWLTGTPDGSGYIVLDQVGDTDITFELMYTSFTNWPTTTAGYSSTTPWLVQNAELLLTAQTMLLFAPIAEEPDWLKTWQIPFQIAKTGLLNHDHELRYSGSPNGFVTTPS